MIIVIDKIIPVGMKKQTAIVLAKSLWRNLKDAGGYISKEELAQSVPLCINCKEVRSLVARKIIDNFSMDTILKTQKEDFTLVFNCEDEEIFVRN